MNNSKSHEEGYALVLVLLIITVFMLLAFSFMGQSANSIKQNDVIEKRYQSIALAEMGTTYYKNAIINDFHNITERAKSAQTEYLSKFDKKDITKTIVYNARVYAIDEAYKLLTNNLINDSNSYLVKLRKYPPSINNLVSFKVDDNITLSPLSDHKTTITFYTKGLVNGIKEENATFIESKLEIDFNSMFVESTDNGGEVPEYTDLIKDPELTTPLNSCKNTINFTNSNCKFTVSKTFAQKEKLIFNQSNLKIFGNLLYGNLNNDNLNQSVLYVTGDFNNGNQNKLLNTNIFVGRNALFNNLNSAENVKIEVKGKAEFKNLNIGTNVLICVNELNAIGQIGSGVKVYAKKNNTTNNNVDVDPNAFLPGGACSGNSSSSGNSGWTPDQILNTPAIINERYKY